MKDMLHITVPKSLSAFQEPHTEADRKLISHKDEHEGYEFYRRELVPQGYARQCMVSLYEIPPGKSSYPYHYHVKNEECFYILSGTGLLKTPSGERRVNAGDFLFFPANENGAHKLTNASSDEPLVYIDFDTYNDLEVSFYPDSGKVGIFGYGLRQLYRTCEQADYYEGE
jgi:uncharacterized cupin superfamily protein